MYLAALASILMTAAVFGAFMILAVYEWDKGSRLMKFCYYGLSVIAAALGISSIILTGAALIRFVISFFR